MKTSPRDLLGLALLVAVVVGASQWWAARSENAVGAEVAALVRAGDIRMLSSDTCVVCASARRWFQAHAIAYTECSIERDSACKAAYERTGLQGTPVLLVRGQPQLGFSPQRLRAALS